MKNLFYSDQEEKNRILEMHVSATKRHYLNEYTGVAFGGEQYGLKLENMEQTSKSKGLVISPQMMGLTPASLKAMNILGAKASQGEQTPSTVVPEDPKAIYIGVTTDDIGDKYVYRIERYAPILGDVNYPFPKWVQTMAYTKGESMSYTRPDGSVEQNAYNKWDKEVYQYNANRPKPEEVTNSFDLMMQTYKINPDDFKKAIISTYSDPKVQALLPKAIQIAQTTQTVPSLYKEVLTSLG
jgi:hypothetical protein